MVVHNRTEHISAHRDGWAFTGMVTNLFMPEDFVKKYSNETTFVIEK
jgi:hypothetical protein